MKEVTTHISGLHGPLIRAVVSLPWPSLLFLAIAIKGKACSAGAEGNFGSHGGNVSRIAATGTAFGEQLLAASVMLKPHSTDPAGLSSERPYRNPQGMQIFKRPAGPPPPCLLCLLRPEEHFGDASLSPSLFSVPRAPLLPSRGPRWVLCAPTSSQSPRVSPGQGHGGAVVPRWARSHRVLPGRSTQPAAGADHRASSRSRWVLLSLPSETASSGCSRSTAGFTGTCSISKAAALLLCWQPTLSLGDLKDLQIQSLAMASPSLSFLPLSLSL